MYTKITLYLITGLAIWKGLELLRAYIDWVVYHPVVFFLTAIPAFFFVLKVMDENKLGEEEEGQ